MRTRLLFIPLLLLVALFSAHTSRASHFMGGELTYRPLGNNMYRIKLIVYRDCSGAALYATATLDIRNASCTSAQAMTAPLLGSSVIGGPYCASMSGGCGSGLPTNYEMGTYEWTVTLAPNTEWRLSVTDSARPDLANINGNTNIYYEAALLCSVAW